MNRKQSKDYNYPISKILLFPLYRLSLIILKFHTNIRIISIDSRSRDSSGPLRTLLEEDISLEEVWSHDFRIDDGTFPESGYFVVNLV